MPAHAVLTKRAVRSDASDGCDRGHGVDCADGFYGRHRDANGCGRRDLDGGGGVGDVDRSGGVCLTCRGSASVSEIESERWILDGGDADGTRKQRGREMACCDVI